jgi:hypothetical protein
MPKRYDHKLKELCGDDYAEDPALESLLFRPKRKGPPKRADSQAGERGSQASGASGVRSDAEPPQQAQDGW